MRKGEGRCPKSLFPPFWTPRREDVWDSPKQIFLLKVLFFFMIRMTQSSFFFLVDTFGECRAPPPLCVICVERTCLLVLQGEGVEGHLPSLSREIARRW